MRMRIVHAFPWAFPWPELRAQKGSLCSGKQACHFHFMHHGASTCHISHKKLPRCSSRFKSTH